MSNLILNIRFGEYYFQVTRLSDWRSEWTMGRWPFRWSHNPYQAKARKEEGWKWFEIY